MFCKSCGNEVNDGAAFCPKCGAQVVIPKSMVSDENSSGQTTSEVISDDKKDRTLRLVAAVFFSIWTIFLIRGIWGQCQVNADLRNISALSLMACILISTLIISNLCTICAILKQESKFFKASFVIGLLGNAFFFIYRGWKIYSGISSLPGGYDGYVEGISEREYVIRQITGYSIYGYELNTLFMWGSLTVILGIVLFVLFILKINHNISSILIIIVAVLWTTCSVRWFLMYDVSTLLHIWKPLFFLATFTGTAAYALLSIILTRKQAQ